MWELSQNLGACGEDVTILVPPEDGKHEQESVGKVAVQRSGIGSKLNQNRPLDRSEASSLEPFDRIVSINNYGLTGLRPALPNDRLVKVIHSLAHDRAVSTYLSLDASLREYLRMYLARRRERTAEKRGSGIKTICVSRYLCRRIGELKLEESRNISYVPNGINLSLFSPREPSETYSILFIGRFQRMKGLDVLIRALDLLARNGTRLQIAIVGPFDEHQREFCLSLSSSHLRDRIHFLGAVHHEDIPEAMRLAKLFVSPSRYEGFGLPVLEALACGKPVVAARVGDAPELLGSNPDALADPGNAADLAQKIARAFADPMLEDRAKLEGPRRAASYDWNEVAKEFLEALQG